MRPIVKAVIFDLDGTMFDTEALFHKIAGAMLTERGKVFTPEIMQAMIGRRADEATRAFREMSGLEDSAEAILEEMRRRFFEQVDDAVHPTPGLFALLAKLEKLGIPRAVATSSRREYAEKLLTSHGLRDHFSFILGGQDVTNPKPAPEIYLKAAEHMGVHPSEMIVLEDSPPGVAAAKASGAFTVGVPHEHSPATGLELADLLIDRLDADALFARLEPRTASEF